jgi:hypothetical protein
LAIRERRVLGLSPSFAAARPFPSIFQEHAPDVGALDLVQAVGGGLAGRAAGLGAPRLLADTEGGLT